MITVYLNIGTRVYVEVNSTEHHEQIKDFLTCNSDGVDKDSFFRFFPGDAASVDFTVEEESCMIGKLPEFFSALFGDVKFFTRGTTYEDGSNELNLEVFSFTVKGFHPNILNEIREALMRSFDGGEFTLS